MAPHLTSGNLSLDRELRLQKYPELKSTRRVDVAIVGSGLCALTAALQLYRSGKTVAVVAPAAVVESPHRATGDFFDIIEPSNHAQWFAELGLERANQIAGAYRDAISTLQLLSTQVSECHFASVPSFNIAERATDLTTVEQECAIGKALHGDCWFTGDMNLPFPCVGASRDTFQGKLLLAPLIRAMASELQMLGAELYEHSPCIAPPRYGRLCELRTEHGAVQSNSIIFASRTPHSPIASEVSTLVSHHSYMIAARVNVAVEDAISRLGQDPIRTIWRSDRFDSSKLIFRADYFGDQLMSQQHCLNELACYASSRFHVDKVEARWSHHQFLAADGLPIVGRADQMENVYVAAGMGLKELPWGITSGGLLANLIQGIPSPLSDTLHSARLADRQAKIERGKRSPSHGGFTGWPSYLPELSDGQSILPCAFPSVSPHSGEKGMQSSFMHNLTANILRG